jgi:HEAT repeat protein
VTKLELVKEAAASQGAAMGPLYDMALRFATDNAALLGADPQLRDLALVAAAETGAAGYAKAVDNLWALFQAYKDPAVRAAAITALGKTGSGENRVAENLGAFLASQNSLFRSGVQPEYPALEACIDALGLLGDGSSFPVLFSSYVAGYAPELATKAALALGRIKGDYKGYLLQVIARNPPLEKAAAFSAGMENPAFGGDERGELAEGAMAAALAAYDEPESRSPVELQALRELRLASARQLKALAWQRASPLAIKHFRLVQADYAKGAAAKTELLEAVACLGAMGSTEAAQALALHLQLINAQTEQGSPYDEPLLLAVISALGELGDKAAFDYLLQMGYLQYTDTVKRAARDALLKLKW